jgi:hypothetical protein
MNMIHPMGILRKKIAEAFNFPLKGFKLESRTNEVDSDSDEILFKDFE